MFSVFRNSFWISKNTIQPYNDPKYQYMKHQGFNTKKFIFSPFKTLELV